MPDQWYQFPDGNRVVTHVQYSYNQSRGPLALAVTAGVSLIAVTSMLVAIAVTGFRTQHQFVRSQVGAYFLSLLLSDLLQATGSLMNAKWVVIQAVSAGPFCTVQAALKQTGNVGTALWSLVIATHTFYLLFLRRRIGNMTFYCILFGVWVLIGFVVMMGPVILQKNSRGPFWGVSGYWCWITNSYHIEQLTDEYLFMFITALVSTVLYSLIFFRLRGNLPGAGWNFRFRCVNQPWAQNEVDDSQMYAVGKQMLWYPVAYTIIIVPIAVCRWLVIFGHSVPYDATMTADSIFMLSGFVNAILYSATRKIVSISALLPFSRFIRIVSPRGEHLSRKFSAEYLDDMQFSSPGVSHALGIVADSTPGDLGDPLEMWQRRRGNEFPEYIRAQLMSGKPPPWLTKSDSASGLSDSGDVTEVYTAPKEIYSPSQSFSPHARPSVSPPPSKTHESQHHTEHVDASQATPEIESTPLDALPQRLSESPPTTDSTPSLHHKRFSGWSFPSVRGTAHEGDSVHTDLEEMRFASPSPERVQHKPSSQSTSLTDIPKAPPWLPRSNTFE